MMPVTFPVKSPAAAAQPPNSRPAAQKKTA
jgi:hypothetical protein